MFPCQMHIGGMQDQLDEGGPPGNHVQVRFRLCTSTPTQAMHTARRRKRAPRCPSARRILADSQVDVVKVKIVARMHVTAAHAHRPIRLLSSTQIARKVHICNIADSQQTRPRRRRIGTIVLRDRWTRISSLHSEVREQDVLDVSPSATPRLIATLVARGVDRDASPGLDVGAVVHVLVAADDVHVVDDEVLDARVFEILAYGTESDAVTAVALDVLGADVVASRFDGDAVVATLVDDWEISVSCCVVYGSEVDLQLVSLALLTSIVSNPSVFWTQFLP